MRALAVAVVMPAASLALPAWARSASATPVQQMTQSKGVTHSHMNRASAERYLRRDLTKAGFADVHVMPESFLLRVKRVEGMPVIMVIDPDSLAEVGAVGGDQRHGTTQGNAAAGSVGTVGSNAGGKSNTQ